MVTKTLARVGQSPAGTIRAGHPQCGVSWSPDGTRVATGDCGTHYSPSVARIWDARTGRLVFASKPQGGAIRNIAFSPNGEYVGAPNRDGVADIFDIRTGRVVTTFEPRRSGTSGPASSSSRSPGLRFS